MIGKPSNVLVLSEESQFKNVQDILNYTRAHPGRIFGNGTSAHLASELFKSIGKFDILHIPYKESGPAINDLKGGQIDMIFSTSTSVNAHVKAVSCACWQ